MADDNNKGPLPGLGGAPVNQTAPKPAAPAPAPDKPEDKPADSGKTKILLERDYWPKDQPKPEDGDLVARENRCRAGDVVELPNDEAMDVIEQGHGKRAKGG